MHCIPTPSKIALLRADNGEAQSLGESSPLAPVAWSKDGDRLLFTGKSSVTLYTIDTGKSETVGDDAWVSHPCFHPTTGAIWGIERADQLVECVAGKWVTRFALKE
jgi:hypothetical protein